MLLFRFSHKVVAWELRACMGESFRLTMDLSNQVGGNGQDVLVAGAVFLLRRLGRFSLRALGWERRAFGGAM